MIVGPIEFIHDVLRNPDDDGKRFVLYPAEEWFLSEGFTLTRDGRLRYPEMLFGAPKKTGKTAVAGMAALYTGAVIGGRNAEIYCCANDLDQSVGRVFKACTRIIEVSPMLRRDTKVTGQKIEFLSNGATIEAIASDYAGAAGAAPALTIFDELWAYTSESARRLWDEMVPIPTRKVSGRLTVTYAGFQGESVLLEELYRRGLKGELIS
jgi:hypothetical protein